MKKHKDWQTKDLYNLLLRHFTPQELEVFCSSNKEFEDLYFQLFWKSNDLNEIILPLIRFARRRNLINTLLEWAQNERPTAYKNIFGDHSDSLPNTPVQEPTNSTDLPYREEVKQADVLLVTVTKVETIAVLDAVKREFGRTYEVISMGYKTYYDLGLINGARTFLVRSEMGASGPGGATLTISTAVNDLCPKDIIMVGIAFGMNAEKQQIGDIATRKKSHTSILNSRWLPLQWRPLVLQARLNTFRGYDESDDQP